MNEQIKEQILCDIKSYDRIIISRHSRPDGDAMGSTKGLKEIIKATYPEKEVYLINEDMADYLAFMGGEDEIDPALYAGALVIVCDTATENRISNRNYMLGEKLIKIDHHVDIGPYGDISWVEDQRSSVCEMIADFWYSFRNELTLTPKAAEYIYTGMVTDSGRFKYDCVSGDTLRLAAQLLDKGIDTDKLFANLYLDEYEALKFKSYIYSEMQITENGVAHVFVTLDAQQRFGITTEQACNSVSALDSIKGSIFWIAFIEYPDGSIRARLRSRFMTINKLAEKYHGGGHEKASGATAFSRDEMCALINDADALIKEYKSTHEGWL